MKRSPPVATTLTLLCSIVTLVTLVTLVPSTNAQRATVSLGSKLIQPKDKKRKWGFFKSPGHVDAIELEEERDLEGEWIPIWTAGFVGLVSLVVFMMKVKQKRDGGESGDMATRSDSTASGESKMNRIIHGLRIFILPCCTRYSITLAIPVEHRSPQDCVLEEFVVCPLFEILFF